MVKQYQFPSHKRKRLVVARLLSPTVIKFIEQGPTQAPDLLVYAPDFTGWDFCEVKGLSDNISAVQKEYFSKLEAMSGKKVYMLKIRRKL